MLKVNEVPGPASVKGGEKKNADSLSRPSLKAAKADKGPLGDAGGQKGGSPKNVGNECSMESKGSFQPIGNSSKTEPKTIKGHGC